MVHKLSAAAILACLLMSTSSKLSVLSPMNLQGKFVGNPFYLT